MNMIVKRTSMLQNAVYIVKHALTCRSNQGRQLKMTVIPTHMPKIACPIDAHVWACFSYWSTCLVIDLDLIGHIIAQVCIDVHILIRWSYWPKWLNFQIVLMHIFEIAGCIDANVWTFWLYCRIYLNMFALLSMFVAWICSLYLICW